MSIFKRIILFILIVLTVSITSVQAQLFERPTEVPIPQQSVYLELGGNALVYSLNYDVLFQSGWGFRLGGGYALSQTDFIPYQKPYSTSNEFLGVAMGLRSIGNNNHKLELGAGILIGTLSGENNNNFVDPPGATFSVGYRFLPVEPSHFTFKAAFTPVISSSGFHPGFGLSFGITLTPEGDAKLK
ncbi:hypothetical protein [Fodinibius saliphilus]|uniref:hypothetical protein n=1 Tax=Fodinibius saliphilus TaxID=1920650 RepID=UPI00110A0610|nr:hypothetical protein [Fodinibius saliphilus]